jgi:WD40 repeat protein/energy-coupling factor transporter ATP-binding protein EcfA2
MNNELIAIFDRIANGQFRDADMETLRQFLESGDREVKAQFAKFGVNIGEGKDIHIGDRIYQAGERIYQELDVEAIREIVRSILKEKPQNLDQTDNSQSSLHKTILVLASSPSNEARLRLDKEVREIEDGLRRSQYREKFTLKQSWAVRPDDLRRALLDLNPQIIHFCGHGSGEEGLVLENELGEYQLVPTQALANLFKRFADRGLECVVFNACYSEMQANAISEHIDYVVGMNNKIGDDAAIKFAVGFYDEIGAGWSYEDAYNGGCDAIALQGIPEENTPVFKNKKSPISTDECPYRGLFAFSRNDASFFFGRDNFVKTLVKSIQEKPLVSVIGNSGSGKSSVIFAGLIPKLEESGKWNIADFRPTNNPFFGLAKALLNLFDSNIDVLEQTIRAKKYVNNFKMESVTLKDVLESKLQEFSSEQRFLIVIDQFEELYTLSLEDDKNLFLGQLLEVIEMESKKRTPDVVFLITLRADFYGYALDNPDLGKALQKWKPENLLRMNLDELKLAIEKPAQVVKLNIQKGLTQIILDSIKNNQGELPLLEFTLEKLWQNRSNGELTIDAYDKIGGVEKALANHAEDVYNKLDEDEKKQAQHIFTQLVRFGENTDDTRRLATSEEIGAENWKLVTKLAGSERYLEARLVITGYDESKRQPTVEVVHEALIRGWERLRVWMEKDREFRKWQDRIRNEKHVWESSGKDNGALLRGTLLVEAEEWLKQRSESITNQDEVAFISVSRQYQEQEDIERIEELLDLSQKELQLKQQLSSLVIAVKAGIKLGNIQEPSEELKTNIFEKLQQATYGISEQNQLIGHTREVSGIAISPDGLKLASASNDNTLKLWDLDGKCLNTFQGHISDVVRVSFSPDGQMIASTSYDTTVRLWNLDGTLLRTLEGHTNQVWGVSFSPNGKMLASAGYDTTVRLWSLDGKIPIILEGHTGSVWGVSFSPDSQMIASASFDKTIRLWNLDGTLLRTLEEHTDQIWAVSFSPNGKMIASASADRTVKLWSIEGTLLKTIEGHSDRVYGVSFSPDGQTLASTGADRTIRLWSLDGASLRTIEGHYERVHGISFTPDGQRIASASYDRTVRLWNLYEKPPITLEGHTDQVWGVAFSPDGKILASSSVDKTIRLWGVDGKSLIIIKGHKDRVWGVGFSPDGKMLASSSVDKTIRLWSVDGNLLRILEGHTDEVYKVSFSPDSKMLASSSADKTVRLWSVDGTLLKTLTEHNDRVYGVSFSPDGKMLASASVDKTVRLWSVDGTLLNTLEGHSDMVRGVIFSPDGKILASSSVDGTVRLWSLDGTLLNTLEGHTDAVFGVSFSPDGKMLASSGYDHTVRLWHLNGTLLRTLTGHKERVWGVSFSPDGQSVASASDDRTVRLWRIDPDDLISDIDIKLNKMLKKGCNWIKDYLKTNPNISESDRNICDDICS